MKIYEKLLEVQKEIEAIKKDSVNPHFKNRYFDINSLLAEVKPTLNKHGLVLTQGLTTVGGKLAIDTSISSFEKEPKTRSVDEVVSREKDFISYTCVLPDCPDAQKYGSAITYFRRYALQSLLAIEAEDDDANHASGHKSSTTSSTAAYRAKNKADKDADVDPLADNFKI